MQQNRSIVFINQATGYLTIDIINEFSRSGNFSKVALIAGSIRVQDIPVDKNVEWSKVTLYDRGNPKKKFLSWFRGTLQIGWLLLTRYRKYEIFYITIPPFAYLLSLIFRNRFSILVFDVYPDVLKIYGIKENNMGYRLWTRFNKNLFRRAHRLYTIGEGMAKLLEQYVSRSRITVIHNWSGLTKVREVPKQDNIFIQEHGLHGKFIVQYSGNIGYTHNVEVLVELAKAMKAWHDVFFLIIGRGEKYNQIKAMVEAAQLSNCKLLPFQPDDMLNYTLSAADLGVVLLDDKTAHVSIPSKIYNLQAVGVPILGIADTTSELSHHLQAYNNGQCFASRDMDSIIAYIARLKDESEQHRALQISSRAASADFTMLNAKKYLESYVL
jgi:glycosyltransferase involved in cell wall biosynthesis